MRPPNDCVFQNKTSNIDISCIRRCASRGGEGEDEERERGGVERGREGRESKRVEESRVRDGLAQDLMALEWILLRVTYV